MVNDAQDVVALGDIVHEHAYREEIVDLFERLVPLLHFLIDRPEILRTAGNLRLGEPGALQFLRERLAQALDGLLTLNLPCPHLPGQRPVVLGLEELKRQVFELGLHARHAEAVGQRRVDLAGLERDPTTLLRV